MGCIFPRGNIQWIKYYRNGKPIYESSHSAKKEDAKHLLRVREGEIANGNVPAKLFDKILLAEILDDLLVEYRIKKRKNLDNMEYYIRNLKDFFLEWKANRIQTGDIQRYMEKRQKDGVADSSINRELSALKTAFILALRHTPPKVLRTPYIPMLKENNIRTGFLERDDYLKLMAALPFPVNCAVSLAYKTGLRKGEILSLKLDQLDLEMATIRLNPGETKNDEGRVVYLDHELIEEMKMLYEKRHSRCPYLFHRNGQQIKSFASSWPTALAKCGLEGKLFHDLRRTAVRNMIRAGIPERVAMTISGHKTRSVFDRYNIVSEGDLKKAALQIQRYVETGDNLVTVTKKREPVIVVDHTEVAEIDSQIRKQDDASWS